MARKTVIQYLSDISGEPIEKGGAVQFGLDGTNYEIDLTESEQQQLRQAMAAYIDAGRRTRRDGRVRRSATPATPATTEAPGTPSSKEVREWAMKNGHDTPARGRIPAAVREAYDVAHRM